MINTHVMTQTKVDGTAAVNLNMFLDGCFGRRLKVLRKQRRISRDDLANMLGVETEVIGSMESSPWDVPIDVISRTCDALGISIFDPAEADPKYI